MQKWSPEPFALEQGTVIFGTTECAHELQFQPQENEAVAQQGKALVRFKKESGFASDAALMSHLTQDERATVFELVEIDVAEKYEAMARKKQDEFQQQLAEMRADFGAWASSFQEQTYQELREIAASCIDLALELAQKIVRAKVELDPDVLVRTLETALFKVPAGQSLNLTVNPTDAVWLDENPEISAKLRLGTITGDRRIDRGGCKIESRGQEWDATLSGQVDALGEMIHELMTTLPAADPIPRDPQKEDPVGDANPSDMEETMCDVDADGEVGGPDAAGLE